MRSRLLLSTQTDRYEWNFRNFSRVYSPCLFSRKSKIVTYVSNISDHLVQPRRENSVTRRYTSQLLSIESPCRAG